MQVSAIRAKARRLTKTDSTSYTDANVLIDINIAQEKVVNEILKHATYANEFVVEKYYDLKATDNLSAGDIGYNGEYPFESGFLRPLRAEISYDASNWNPANVMTLNQSGESEFTEDDINSQYSQENPYVMYLRNSYFVRPLLDGTTDVTAGLHLWWLDMPADVAEDTDIPAGNTVIHDVYPHLVAMEYFKEHPDKYNALVEKGLTDALDRLRDFYSQRMNFKRTITPYRHSFK